MKNEIKSDKANYGEMGHALTIRMAKVVDKLKEEYASLYNTRDFASKIKYLDKCDSDEIGSVKEELVHMFNMCGITDVKNMQSSSYYAEILEKSNIPTPKEMTHKVYESLLKKFTENPYPLPEEYIERIVDRRINNEWKNDTLRLKILKKFIKDADGLTSAGYNKCIFIRSYVEKKIGKKNLSWDDVVSNLDDGVFFEMEKELSESRMIQKKYEEDKVYIEITTRINERKKILSRTEEYKKLQKEEKKIFINKDREIIELKKIIEPTEDAINKEKNKRKGRTKKNGKFALLKIADDLAYGRFGNADVVREEIYLFAIVFELMFFTEEDIISEDDKAIDIEKVMFGDYYANNIMRYIASGHEYIKSGGEQQDPTGKGINFKNYMEAIYLYYMRRDIDIKTKLKEIYKMANDVYVEFRKSKDKSSFNRGTDKNRTRYYEDAFMNHVLENEDQFKEFLICNYDCSMPPETSPVFSVEAEQNTAIEEYYLLMDEAEDYGIGYGDYEQWTLSFLEDEMDVDRVKRFYEDKKRRIYDYKDIDNKTKFDILLYEVNRDICKVKKQKELDKKIISRADILRLFYQLYICMNDGEDEAVRSFPAVYDDFSELANQHLENAMLRPINGRDLYDLILIYSAYCNINDGIFYKEIK